MRLRKILQSTHFRYVMGVLLLTLVTYRILHFFHLPHLETLANVSYQPITGHPYWRAFQNRLLGSSLMYLLMAIPGVSQLLAFKLISIGILLLTFSSAYLLFNKVESGPREAFGYVCTLAFLLVGLQDQKWMLIWDYIDILVFLFLFYGIFQGKSVRYFLGIFVLGILNRESALFIPLWVMLDSVELKNLWPVGWKIRKFLVGLATMIGGIVYTWWIRHTLFIESHVEWVGKDMAHAGVSNHWNLSANVEALYQNLVNLQLDIVGSIFVAVIVYYCIVNLRNMDETAKKAAILMGGMVVSIWVFGLINELRQYFMLVPGVLFLHQRINKDN